MEYKPMTALLEDTNNYPQDKYQKELAEYISILTHDIKPTTLAQIRILEYLLNKPTEQTSKQRELLTLALKSNCEQYQIINNFIEILKNKRFETELNKRYFNLNENIKEIITSTTSIRTKKNVTTTINLPPKSLIFNGDEKKLTDSLYKILKHASMRALQHSKIDINLKPEESTNQITLKITEYRDDDFKQYIPTNQIKSKTLTKKYNLLGSKPELKLAEEIINLHDGIIEESQTQESIEIKIKLPI